MGLIFNDDAYYSGSEYRARQHFVEYAKQIMNDRGIRPWYAAYYVEVNDTTFGQAMKGQRFLGPIKLIMIAELFECTVNEMLGYESVDVPTRTRLFDSGFDTKKVIDYFSDRLSEKVNRIDIDELARAIKLTVPTVTRYIEGDMLPDTAILIRICDYLDCTPSELLGY